VDGFTQVYGNDQAPLKLQKITEEDRLIYTPQTNYMHRDKGNTAADKIRTAVFSIPKGVGTNGTLVHEMSHSSDRTGRSTGERPITDVKE
jgi:hypothetical protein